MWAIRGVGVPVGAVALASALSAVYLLYRGDPAAQAISCWSAVAVFASAMTYYAFQAIRIMEPGDVQRRFWRTFAYAGVIFSLGEYAQLATVIADPGSASALTGTGPARMIALACGGLALVIVLVTYPLPHRSAHDRLCYQLDLATVVVAAGAYGLYWTVTGGAVTQETIGVASGPVLAMLAAFAAGRLYLSGTAPFHWQIGVIAPVAAVAEGVARALGPELARAGRPGLVFVLSVWAHALLMVSAWVQFRRYRSVAPKPRRRPYSLLPYVALAAVFGLLLVTLAIDGLDLRAWIILLGAVACSTIVVARQLIAFIDNARLLTERDALTSRLHMMAFTDSLTGVGNRALFLDTLSASLRENTTIGVLLVDLDDFKPVNDVYGHAAGDAVLVEAARRLRSSVRETDLVARLGGDEFAVLVADEPAEGFPAVADRIVRALNEPCRVTEQTEVVTRASVGLAVSNGGRDASYVLNLADQAMYDAKGRGKGSYRIAGSSAV